MAILAPDDAPVVELAATGRIMSAGTAVECRPQRVLSLLRGFEMRSDDEVLAVPANVERVVAFLAVQERPQLRSTVAAALWMDSPEERAAANLRTAALWKARQGTVGWLVAAGNHVGLAPDVEVDLVTVVGQARRLIGPDDVLEAADARVDTLLGDLLPEWDEEWILFERERLRQLRIHALESLCQRLSDRGRYGEAVEAGLAAVAAEPLRESAQRILISVHVAEGNLCEARRQHGAYERLLLEGLGIAPSDGLRQLVGLPAAH